MNNKNKEMVCAVITNKKNNLIVLDLLGETSIEIPPGMAKGIVDSLNRAIQEKMSPQPLDSSNVDSFCSADKTLKGGDTSHFDIIPDKPELEK